VRLGHQGVKESGKKNKNQEQDCVRRSLGAGVIRIRKMRSTLSIMFVLIATFGVAQDHINFFEGTLLEAQTEAKTQDKLVYVDCQTSWCGPCKKMEAVVFINADVAAYYNEHFICMSMDMEKGEGPDVAILYGISGYPTHLFLDAKGDMMHRDMGLIFSEEFIDIGRIAMNPNERNGRFAAMFKEGNREPEFLKKYLDLLTDSRQSTGFVIDAYFGDRPMDDELSSDDLKMLFGHTDAVSDESFERLIKNEAAIVKKYTQSAMDRKYQKICVNSAAGLIAEGQDVGKLTVRCKDLGKLDIALLYIKMPSDGQTKDFEQYVLSGQMYVHEYMLKNIPLAELTTTKAGKAQLKKLQKEGKWTRIRYGDHGKEKIKANTYAVTLALWTSFITGPKGEGGKYFEECKRWMELANLISPTEQYQLTIDQLTTLLEKE